MRAILAFSAMVGYVRLVFLLTPQIRDRTVGCWRVQQTLAQLSESAGEEKPTSGGPSSEKLTDMHCPNDCP